MIAHWIASNEQMAVLVTKNKNLFEKMIFDQGMKFLGWSTQ